MKTQHATWLGAALLLALPTSSWAASISGKVTAKRKKYQENVVVYVEKASGNFAPTGKAVMHQKNQAFAPFVLPVVKGTTVDFLNDDNTQHNVFSPDGEGYNLGTWGAGQTRSYTFKKEGVYTQLCKMHPSMLGYIVVVQNPYYAVTKADGSFEIKDVPPGDYTLAVWSERMKADKVPVKVSASGASGVTIALKH